MRRVLFFLWTSLLFLPLLTHAAIVQLGSGDTVKISVYNNPDLSLETKISEGGEIRFPFIGNVLIGGMSPSAAEKKIADLLQSGGFLRKADVNLLVTTRQSGLVSVLGQVNRPGRYLIEGRLEVMDLLALAGGLSADGGESVLLFRTRDGKTNKERIDIGDRVLTGKVGHTDFELAGNDIVYVERAPRFYIYGEVQHPGGYRLERSMTVLQALAVGGGLTPRGTERGMRIKRRDTEGVQQIIRVKPDDVVLVDDVVYIEESLF